MLFDFLACIALASKKSWTSKEINDTLADRVYLNKPICVAYLLERGADPDANGFNSGSALFEAVHFGYIKIVKALIGAGANINITRNSTVHDCFAMHNNLTALTIAVGNGNTQLVDILIHTPGIDLNIAINPNTQPMTALDIAIEKKHHDIEEILKKAGALTAAQVQTANHGAFPQRQSAPALAATSVSALDTILQMSGPERRKVLKEVKEKCGPDFSFVANPVALQGDLRTGKNPFKKIPQAKT